MVNKVFIIEALHLTPVVYEIVQHECAKEWLNRYLLSDIESVEIASKGPLFIMWWKNQWELRNNKFLYETSLQKIQLPLDFETLCVALELYHDAHEPQNVIAVPSKHVRFEIMYLLKQEELRIKSQQKK